jgi:hypothetical protein
MELDSRWARRPELKWKTLEEGALIVDECEGKVYRLNATGTEIWKALDGHQTVKNIIHRMGLQFAAAEDKIQKDSLKLFQYLLRHDLIERTA